MEREALVSAVTKLAVAGARAGFSLEQMIQLLDSGLSVESFVDLIAWRFECSKLLSVSSHWAV